MSQSPSRRRALAARVRSEEHTSELQSRLHLVCRLLLEKKKNVPPRQPCLSKELNIFFQTFSRVTLLRLCLILFDLFYLLRLLSSHDLVAVSSDLIPLYA